MGLTLLEANAGRRSLCAFKAFIGVDAANASTPTDASNPGFDAKPSLELRQDCVQ